MAVNRSLPLTLYFREPRPFVFLQSIHTDKTFDSRRMSMGLVVGFLVNILFGMWRFLLDSS